jgi:hypothetical protein
MQQMLDFWSWWLKFVLTIVIYDDIEIRDIVFVFEYFVTAAYCDSTGNLHSSGG